MQGADSLSRSNPQTTKRQHKTANCVICLSSLIPQRIFEAKKPMMTKQASKMSDFDNLLTIDKGSKFKDKHK
jgi:hypothetical protein